MSKEGMVYLSGVGGSGSIQRLPGAGKRLLTNYSRPPPGHIAAAIDRCAGLTNPNAQDAICWTRDQLGAGQRAFIEALPLVL
jgi:hypothetical protein